MFDDSFDPLYRHYHLYFQIGYYNLCACIVQPGEKKFIALEDFRFSPVDGFNENFEQAISESRLFTMESFRKAGCCSLLGISTWVPDPLYSKEYERLYFNFNSAEEKDTALISDDVKLVRAKNIYSFPAATLEILKKRFNNLSICHHSSLLVNSVLLHSKKNDEKSAFIYLRHDSFDLVITENRNLIYCNTYVYETCEDFLYFVLYTFDQLHLNNEAIQVTMAGEIDPAFFSGLNKYIRKLERTKKSNQYIFPFPFHILPETDYFSLFNQPLCEL